ncbi:MAG: hypothetical protein NTV94_14755 [Planctomycetota bacterium]|nr:hypothetical protein [Planctomycetota bacterium]
MTDQALESLLSSLDVPEFAPGHQERLAVRLGHRSAPSVRARSSPREVAVPRRDELHHRRGRPLGAWFALAAMLLFAAALALQFPSPRPRDFVPPASALPRWAAATEPLVIRTDLFASRRLEPTIDIRRWSTHSGVSP